MHYGFEGCSWTWFVTSIFAHIFSCLAWGLGFLMCCWFVVFLIFDFFVRSVILATYLWCCCIYCSIEYYVLDSVYSCRICTASKICKEYTPSGCCASNTKIYPTNCATSWASPLLTSPLLPSLPPPPHNPFLQI